MLSIIRSLQSVYPASKIFSSLLEHGLASPDGLVRAQTARELGDLLQRQGLLVCQPRRAFSALATQLADRESPARSAALDALIIAHGIAGDELFEFVGPLPERSSALLRERLPAASSRGALAVPATAPSPRSRLPGARPHTVPALYAQIPASDITAASLAAACEAVLSSVPDVSVGALKHLVTIFTSGSPVVIEHADAMIEAVTMQMRASFNRLGPTTPSAAMRLCRHLLHTLSTLFDERNLAQAISRSALVQLLSELTRRLLETAEVTTYEPVVNLSRALNMVLIRIFHNSARTACFGCVPKPDCADPGQRSALNS